MRKLWIAAVAAVCLAAAANHAEREWRLRRAAREATAAARSGPLVPVREEDGPGGHRALILDEAALSLPGEDRFRFSDLEAWAWDPVRRPKPPAPLAALNGRKAAAAGFMMAEGAGERVETFFLVPLGSTEAQAGHEDHDDLNLPGLNHRLFVRASPAVPRVRGRPAVARGRLVLDPRPDDGYLVRMDLESLEPAGDPAPPVPASEAARLPRLDFFWLEDLGFQDGKGLEIRFPPGLAALEGRRVVVEGYPTERDFDPPPTFLLAREPWDGCCGGVAPTHFTAVLVGPAPGEPLPPPWTPRIAVAGILRLIRDPEKWTADGIVRIENARACPALGDLDPLVPLWVEILALAAVLLVPAVPQFLKPPPEPRGNRPARADEPPAGPPEGRPSGDPAQGRP
ncbi:MAG: hypothetical protein MUC63_03755 [Planctomycetes bacterium]|nr:hypothetical protein [Planctomycetota bacterium]